MAGPTAFLASFLISVFALFFGSRVIITHFDLFPGDNTGDPLTLANILHEAWGVRKYTPEEEALLQDQDFLKKYTTQMEDFALPLFIAGGLAATAILALYFIGFGSRAKPVLKPDEWQEFKLVKKTAVSPNTAIYRFALPNPTDILGLPIGQHISVQAEIDGKNVMRSYTPTSSDDDKGYFELMVKAYEQGKLSRYLSLLSVGQNVRVKGPKGQFKYTPTLCSHICMIAGGTGITPMLQIIRAALKNNRDQTKLSLIYANVGFEDILLKAELDALVKDHKDRFDVYYVLNNPPAEGWEGGVGFVTKEMIEKRFPPAHPERKILLCGPGPMMNVMKTYTATLGWEAPRTVSKLQDQTFLF